MELSKEEIEEELTHKRAVIKALMRRRRPFELQAAQKGSSTPPEVLNEIADITDQIRAQEEEAARLRTLAAEDKIPLAEAEYRAVLAEVWQSGKPTVAGTARQELARLQLGLVPEQAQRIEQSVRTALAEETMDRLSKFYFEQRTAHLAESAVPIAQAVRLDSQTALKLLLNRIPRTPNPPFGIEYFKERFFSLNEVWPDDPAYDLYQRFLADFEATYTEWWPTGVISDNS